MKVFKWIYYPILIVLLAVFVTLGFTGVVSNKTDSGFDEQTRARVDKHIETITGYGKRTDNLPSNITSTTDYIRTQVRADESGVLYRSNDRPNSETGLNSSTTFGTEQGVPRPSVVNQYATLLDETVAKIDGLEDGTYYVGRTVNNIIVAIPGADTIAKAADVDNEELSYGDAIMFTAHYDTTSVSSGAANNTAAVANMIELAKTIAKRETPYKNDFVFVFTAAEEEGALGAYAFKYQFTGFNDIASRVKLAFNFDAVGSTGALIMSQVTNENSNLVSAYAKIGAKSYSSSVYSKLFASDNLGDFAIYNDIAAYNAVTLPDENSGTAYDTIENLDANVVDSFGGMMNKAASYFGDGDLGAAASEGNRAAFFNYLGVTVWYVDYAAYIIAAIIILIVGAIVFFAIRKKSLNFAKIGLGAAVQLLTMLAVLVSMYVGFLIVTLLLSGFEVINIHAIGSVVYTNAGLLIFAIILCLALSVIYYSVLKKVFAVRATDVVRGNALLNALFAVILCFAAPTVSYLFFPVAFLQTAVMLITVLLKDNFKARFGFDIERLFLYVIPVILIMPVAVAELYLATKVTAAVMLPVYLLVFMLYGGAIMPYADYLARPIGKLVALLPERTVRVERVVTEQIEDEAKKGKFTTVTHAKIFKEKEQRKYRNAFGVTVVSVISVVAIVLFSAFGAKFGKGFSSSYNHVEEIYKDALVYVDDGTAATLEVRDLDAYKYIAAQIDGFKWDSTKNAYTMTDASNSLNITTKPSVTQDTANKNKFTVTLSDSAVDRVTVKLSGYEVGTIDKVKFTSASGTVSEHDVSADSAETFTFVLPYNYESGFTMEIEGDAATVNIDVEQEGRNTPLANNHSIFSILTEEYSLDNDVKDKLTMNVILKVAGAYTLA